MSLSHALSALHLEMPPVIPRTEYSAEYHLPLVRRVTGLPVPDDADWGTRFSAAQAFIRAWDYGLLWNVLVGKQILRDQVTQMGHGVYSVDGSDFDSATKALFQDPEEVYRYDFDAVLGPLDEASLVRDFNANYETQRKLFPDIVTMTGVYDTLMSGLIDMLGWDMLLLAAGTDPAAFGAFTDRYAAWIAPCFRALAASDAPVVMVHDDIVWTQGPFIHPDFYRAHIFPHYRRFFGPLREAGKTVLFTTDGNADAFLGDLAESGVGGFVVEPLTDLSLLAERYGQTHVIVGNADTRILLSGSREDIRNEVRRCIDIGRRCPGFFMAVGNHIPPNTPVDNALWYNECFESMRRR